MEILKVENLMKSIVEKDNGTISVDWNENGSEFVIKYRKY